VNSVMDYIMLGLFVLFMFFIFGGYHQNKFEEREKSRKAKEDRDAQEEKEGSSN